jgi:hypothetical protein
MSAQLEIEVMLRFRETRKRSGFCAWIMVFPMHSPLLSISV